MNKCSVYICESKKEYEGQYEFMNAGMEVEIFNYHAPSEENVSIGDEVKYKEITIVDLRNRVFVFSPVFYNVGVTYALTQYEKYKTDFYFTTGKVDSVDSFSCNMKMSTLKMYHPLLMQCFNNPALQVSCGESEMNYKVIRNSDKKVVEIQNNNIKKIEFGGKCTYSRKNNGQLITIEAENYATIYLDEPITYKDLLMYIKEFDVLVNAYCPSGLHSYATYITTIEGKSFEVIHKLLGKEKFCDKIIHQPVKLNFFEYIERMYKNINYRTTDDRNKYIPLEFKKPTSLEDQYIFYFRYIDLYMGDYLKQKTGKVSSNFDRLSNFVDENLKLFDSNDTMNIDNFKNELNSLRNQYVHEGYYLPNNQFAVNGKGKVFLYHKTMDYNWLLRIVKVFKFGVYKILYTKVLDLEIDEGELKSAVKCWF